MPIQQASAHFDTVKKDSLIWFQKEIASLRSGRVKPDIVDSLTVEVYGARTPLQGLASIGSSDPRTLVISPWDKSTVQAIEKAITAANLGVNPTVDGQVIRLSFPSLTEEVREHTTKKLHAKAEEARIRLRQGRDESLRILKTEKEKGTIPEDDFYNGKEKLDALIDTANEELASIIRKKEEEILTI